MKLSRRWKTLSPKQKMGLALSHYQLTHNSFLEEESLKNFQTKFSCQNNNHFGRNPTWFRNTTAYFQAFSCRAIRGTFTRHMHSEGRYSGDIMLLMKRLLLTTMWSEFLIIWTLWYLDSALGLTKNISILTKIIRMPLT